MILKIFEVNKTYFIFFILQKLDVANHQQQQQQSSILWKKVKSKFFVDFWAIINFCEPKKRSFFKSESLLNPEERISLKNEMCGSRSKT